MTVSINIPDEAKVDQHFLKEALAVRRGTLRSIILASFPRTRLERC